MNDSSSDDDASDTPQPTFAPGRTPRARSASGPQPDLSGEIAGKVARDAGEQVTCTRVAPNHYRCNWWARQSTVAYDNPSIAGALSTTSRICRSHYLHVTKSNEQLTITVITPTGERRVLGQMA